MAAPTSFPIVAPGAAASPDPRLGARYPRLTEYLASVPGGLDAYPECQARSGILQTFLEAGPALDGELDPFVARLVEPPARGFIPEVVLNAGFLAVGDHAGMSEAAYVAWHRAANARLFQGLIFRAIMSVFSPMVLLDRAPSRWESFHAGTRLNVKKDGPQAAIAELTFPPHLYSELHLRGIAQSFVAALEHARGRDVVVELGAHAPAAAVFLARWR